MSKGTSKDLNKNSFSHQVLVTTKIDGNMVIAGTLLNIKDDKLLLKK
jgi:hypothetical protein